MKFGMRKPSIKKSISARTKGRLTRTVKKQFIPGYGTKKSALKIIHPVKSAKKSVYNKVYRKTSFSIFDIFKLFK